MMRLHQYFDLLLMSTYCCVYFCNKKGQRRPANWINWMYLCVVFPVTCFSYFCGNVVGCGLQKYSIFEVVITKEGFIFFLVAVGRIHSLHSLARSLVNSIPLVIHFPNLSIIPIIPLRSPSLLLTRR